MTDTKIYHIHFRKTGGTALRRVLRRAVSPANPLDLFSDLEFFQKVPAERRKQVLAEADFISGHFGRLGVLVGTDFMRICVFRDPLRRVVSGYNHMRNDRRDPMHAKLGDSTLCVAIRDPGFARELWNHQSRLLIENAGEKFDTMTDKQRIECALEFLDKVAIIGVLEHPRALLAALERNLGVPFPSDIPLFNTEITAEGVGKCEIYNCVDQIMQKNRIDIAIYSAVLARLGF